jgi:hypothetical protein
MINHAIEPARAWSKMWLTAWVILAAFQYAASCEDPAHLRPTGYSSPNRRSDGSVGVVTASGSAPVQLPDRLEWRLSDDTIAQSRVLNWRYRYTWVKEGRTHRSDWQSLGSDPQDPDLAITRLDLKPSEVPQLAADLQAGLANHLVCEAQAAYFVPWNPIHDPGTEERRSMPIPIAVLE